MTATATQATIDAFTIARAVGKEFPLSGVIVVPQNTVAVRTATGGYITVAPSEGGWDFTVRDHRGSPTPFAGVQSSYHYRSASTAAQAVILALAADAERAA